MAGVRSASELRDAIRVAGVLVDSDCWTVGELVGTLTGLVELAETCDWCAGRDDDTECGCECHAPAPWDGCEACYVCGKVHDPATCGYCDRCGGYHLAELDCAPRVRS